MGAPGSLIARPQPLAIDPARAALIVVDMQNAFVHKGGMFDLAGMDVAGAQGVPGTSPSSRSWPRGTATS
jgi:ureidoacrylate peracid hydrolase